MSAYNNRLNPRTRKYEPTKAGQIAMGLAVAGTLFGILTFVVGMMVSSIGFVCFVIGLASELVAILSGVAIVVDIVAFNRRVARENESNKKGQLVKKEKDIANILHLIAGLAIGLLLGYMFWGR